VTFTVKTKNLGSESAGGFYICYYVDGSYYDRDYVSSLSAGSTTTTSFSWTAECGNYAIKAVADCYDAVTESDEENAGTIEIKVKADPGQAVAIGPMFVVPIVGRPSDYGVDVLPDAAARAGKLVKSFMYSLDKRVSASKE